MKRGGGYLALALDLDLLGQWDLVDLVGGEPNDRHLPLRLERIGARLVG